MGKEEEEGERDGEGEEEGGAGGRVRRGIGGKEGKEKAETTGGKSGQHRHMVPALSKQSKGDQEFKASLGSAEGKQNEK